MVTIKNVSFQLALLVVLTSFAASQSSKTIEFPSSDGLTITADVYEVDQEKPYALLCHQASFSRGEYKETASLFNVWGYNAMAIDQRSGSTTQGVRNETAKRAADKGLPNKYIDAKQDIEAAIDYLYEKSGKPIVLVGSSYSATLVLMLAKDNPKVSAVISFSAGEYYKGMSIADEIAGLKKPTFVTSSKSEAAGLTKLIRNIPKESITQFIPGEQGKHGSKAMWKDNANHMAYRDAVESFLKGL